MSRSYWRYIAAVVGWLILSGAVLFSIYPEQPHLTGNSGYQKEQIGYRAGGYDCQPAQIDKLPDTKRASRAVSCQEAKEQHRLQANDLIQQRRAADAAEASAIFAFQQTRIGAWGVVVGLTTLMAAIAAAYYARHAALETRRTADFAEESIRHAKHSAFISNRGIQAAKDGNRIAERSAREQLRPYVFVSSALIMRGPALDDPMRIRIKITNYGATPARDLRVKMNWAVLPHPLPHPFDDTQLGRRLISAQPEAH